MPDDKKTEENKKPDVLDLSTNPQFKQLLSVVGTLGKGIQTLQTSVQQMSETVAKGLTKPDEKKTEKQVTDDDVNNMTQAEFAAHMFKGMRKMVDGVSETVNKQLSEVAETTHRTALTMDINEFRGKHKDFDDWIPEIREKLTANPALSAQEAYTLVKANNPEKATELATKYADIDDSKGKGNFGGLRPNQHSEGKSGKGDENSTEMTRTEAAEAAWEEAFGSNPTLAGEDMD